MGDFHADTSSSCRSAIYAYVNAIILIYDNINNLSVDIFNFRDQTIKNGLPS